MPRAHSGERPGTRAASPAGSALRHPWSRPTAPAVRFPPAPNPKSSTALASRVKSSSACARACCHAVRTSSVGSGKCTSPRHLDVVDGEHRDAARGELGRPGMSEIAKTRRGPTRKPDRMPAPRHCDKDSLGRACCAVRRRRFPAVSTLSSGAGSGASATRCRCRSAGGLARPRSASQRTVRWLAEHGEPADPRTDIDTASLKRRFPHLETSRLPTSASRDRTAGSSRRGCIECRGAGIRSGFGVGPRRRVHRGHLDMPEANWVSLELAARGIPVLSVDYVKCLGDVHFPEPTDEVRTAWQHARAHAEELFGLDANAVLLGGASAGGNLTAGAVGTAAGCRRRRCRPGSCSCTRPFTRMGPRHPPRSTPPHRTGNSRRTSPGRTRPCATLTPSPHSGAWRLPADARRRLREGRPASLGRSVRASARGCRNRGVGAPEPGAGHGHINEPSDPTALPTIAAMAEWIGHEVRTSPNWCVASLRGAVDVEVGPTGLAPLRLPRSARAQTDWDWMRIAAEQASGVRCEFRTAATWIELTVETTGLYLPWIPDESGGRCSPRRSTARRSMMPA